MLPGKNSSALLLEKFFRDSKMSGTSHFSWWLLFLGLTAHP